MQAIIDACVAAFKEKKIRVRGDLPGKPLFCAIDVAHYLDADMSIAEVHQSVRKFTNAERALLPVTNATGRPEIMLFLTLPGLYRYCCNQKTHLADELCAFTTATLATHRASFLAVLDSLDAKVARMKSTLALIAPGAVPRDLLANLAIISREMIALRAQFD